MWVLLPLALLCLGVIVWTFWPASAESLYRQGAELMARDDPAAWERAWTEYLAPLSERYPDNPHRTEVEQFPRKIEAVREPQRFYQRGTQLLREGNSAAAARIWKDLVVVFAGNEVARPWVARAEKELAELDKKQASTEQSAAVRAALKRAKTLHAEGRRADAEQIWDSLEDLYRNDFAARALLKEVREARQQK